MDTGTGYFGHVAISAGTVRGRALLDPALEIELKIQADGLAPGVAAMILDGEVVAVMVDVDGELTPVTS